MLHSQFLPPNTCINGYRYYGRASQLGTSRYWARPQTLPYLYFTFFLFAALALKCYQCSLNISSISDPSALLRMGTICGKPNVTMECSEPGQDSCATITITGKAPPIGKVVVHSLKCSSKMACGELRKNMTCATMTNALKNATVAYGAEITSCEMACCQGDLCNNPAVPSPSVATSPDTSPGNTTQSPAGKTTVKSSTKSIRSQTSCAVFGILGAISVAFMNIF